jgi:hypothetical protein
MPKKGKVKLQFTGPVTCDTHYGRMDPGDTVDVEKKVAEEEVKQNPRLWRIEGQDANPIKKTEGGKK